jgi:hypothetical protein
MSEMLLRVNVPEGEELVAAVSISVRPDGQFTVQEYRQAINFTSPDMVRALTELATTLELEQQFTEGN